MAGHDTNRVTVGGAGRGAATRVLAMLLGLVLPATLLLALAPTAEAAPGQRGSLPSVGAGELPGPPLLYRKPAKAPQLRNRKPFGARPLLVSGTDAYRGGEYLYQDYLFDDYGANLVSGRGTHTPGADDVASQTDGDIFYPTAEKYANNAADIVEFRVLPKREAVLYRITLNTLIDRAVPMIGIGIDEDRSRDDEVAWAGGAGVTSPGLDSFIRFSGSEGRISFRDDGSGLPEGAEKEADGWASLPLDSVRTSLRRNQITVRVPRPGPGAPGRKAKVDYYLGAGLSDGAGSFLEVPAAGSPDESTPASGTSQRDAPAIFNLGFRWHEPQKAINVAPYDSFPGAGVWFEAEQSRRLADGSSGDFRASVDFAPLEADDHKRLHRPAGRTRARILSSRLDIPEGVRPGTFPKYGGSLQPYLITVPPGYRPGDDGGPGGRDPGKTPGDVDRVRRLGLTLTMHSLGGNYTQYLTYSPNQLRQLGLQRDNIVISPLARGTDGWYHDEAEVDTFEVWADVAHRYKLDPRRAYPTGYSMGGYGTYKLGVEYPDLWARAFTTVGPPGEGIWVPPAQPSAGAATNSNTRLENVRWVPYMNWAEVEDELVPYAGVRAQLARFNELGLRNQLFSFTPGEHFTLALLDQWGPAADFLGDAEVVRNPSRVDYVFFPDADRPGLGLVHDSAYWVSGLELRDPAGDPDSDPARGAISARSLAFGEGDPPARRLDPDTVPGLNGLNAIEGTDWGKIPEAPKRNALEVEAENLARGVIEGGRARLAADRELTITVSSDGPGTLLVKLDGLRGARVEGRAELGRGGVIVSYGEGETEVTVKP